MKYHPYGLSSDLLKRILVVRKQAVWITFHATFALPITSDMVKNVMWCVYKGFQCPDIVWF